MNYHMEIQFEKIPLLVEKTSPTHVTIYIENPS